MWSDLKNWDGGGGGGGGVGRWSLGCLVSEMPGAVAVVWPNSHLPRARQQPDERLSMILSAAGHTWLLCSIFAFFVNYLKIGKQMTLNSLESGFN